MLLTLDSSWEGTHTIAFEAYLKDFDTEESVPLQLPITLTLTIMGQQNATIVSTSQLREPPITLETLAPIYKIYEATVIQLDFADPLAIEIQKSTHVSAEMVPSGLEISIEKNELLKVIIAGKATYGQPDVGYGSVQLSYEGNQKTKIAGEIIINVLDKSTGGQSSQFTIKIEIDPEHEDTVDEEASQTEETISQIIDDVATRKEEAKKKANFEGFKPEEPRVKIQSLSSTGQIILAFNNKMTVPRINGRRLSAFMIE